ncbi:MAG: 4Fe-4S binding protein [Promethearchaeota archaeon]
MSWRNISKSRDERPKVQVYKSWKELPPIPISFPANAARTGDWRSLRPVINRDKCTKCATCWLFCPEGTISRGDDAYFVIDYEYCKGCGICAYECPVGAIDMVNESEAKKEDGK